MIAASIGYQLRRLQVVIELHPLPRRGAVNHDAGASRDRAIKGRIAAVGQGQRLQCRDVANRAGDGDHAGRARVQCDGFGIGGGAVQRLRERDRGTARQCAIVGRVKQGIAVHHHIGVERQRSRATRAHEAAADRGLAGAIGLKVQRC